MARSKRPSSSYLQSARENKDLIPSLSKYSRRKKTLSRYEKAAITRAENKIRHAGGRKLLHSLTKQQARSLEKKDVIIGNGIRAVSLRGFPTDAKVTVIKGRIHVKSGKRKWRFVPTAPDFTETYEAAKRAFKRGAKAVDLWLHQGRLGFAAGSLKLFGEQLAAFFFQYTEQPEFEEWFEGIAYFA